MNALLENALWFGVALSLSAYWLGVQIKKKIPLTIMNPLLIAMVLIFLFLKIFRISYETYDYGAKLITNLLTPATVCLAVPLYRQIQILKKNVAAVMAGVFSGCLANAAVILVLSRLLQTDQDVFRSLLPKSVTTAIALGVSEELGGIAAVTIMGVVVTGLLGAIIAGVVFKLFKISEPVAQGLACGTSAHAIGTSKALELGEIQGAMSSLAIIVTGLITVVLSPLFVDFLK